MYYASWIIFFSYYSKGCLSKHKLSCLKITEMYCVTVLEVRIQNQDVSSVMLLLKSAGKKNPSHFLRLQSCCVFLAFLGLQMALHELCLHLWMQGFPCVSPVLTELSACKDTSHIWLGVHPTLVWLHPNWLHLQRLFSKKVCILYYWGIRISAYLFSFF